VTAVIITFPLHPVRIICDEGAGDWLVSRRGWYWQHATHTAALADPHRIAAAHGECVIDNPREDVRGGAA
jgi:hypothetical protein